MDPDSGLHSLQECLDTIRHRRDCGAEALREAIRKLVDACETSDRTQCIWYKNGIVEIYHYEGRTHQDTVLAFDDIVATSSKILTMYNYCVKEMKRDSPYPDKQRRFFEEKDILSLQEINPSNADLSKQIGKLRLNTCQWQRPRL